VPLLDLAYEEDSRADVDMNVIKTRTALHRDPGHGRDRTVRTGPALRHAGAGGCGHRRAGRRPEAGARLDERGPAAGRRHDEPNKLREIRGILNGTGAIVEGLDAFPSVAEPEETGATFEENARQKAVYYSTTSA